jgi:transcriptional regulator with XRE-family HTH domain
MTDVSWSAGTTLRMARQTRGLSQQLAGMAGVSRQAVSALESGHSDPSLRVALALAGALGATLEELFGRGELADPVQARPVAPARPGERVALATIGDTFVALPLRGETAALAGFSAAGGLVPGRTDAWAAQTGDILVRPISPPRPTLLVAGCDPALPLLETPLSLLDPSVAFAWWPSGSGEAMRLAAAGLVHAAGVHRAAEPLGFHSLRRIAGLHQRLGDRFDEVGRTAHICQRHRAGRPHHLCEQGRIYAPGVPGPPRRLVPGQRMEDLDAGGGLVQLIAVDHIVQRPGGVEQANRDGAAGALAVPEDGPQRHDPRAARRSGPPYSGSHTK